ncbi:hypothetical protein IWW34DRAFT_776033 [Fusarium oxysporum f. sp. albedinis]|nr:hypothetical protein IWW34DRAFT_776033 [Fusarium oxysporum f. sp. albedinis]
MPRIRQKTYHSPHKRTRFITMYESGVRVKDIADKEGLSRYAIYGVIRRYRHQQSVKIFLALGGHQRYQI